MLGGADARLIVAQRKRGADLQDRGRPVDADHADAVAIRACLKLASCLHRAAKNAERSCGTAITVAHIDRAGLDERIRSTDVDSPVSAREVANDDAGLGGDRLIGIAPHGGKDAAV